MKRFFDNFSNYFYSPDQSFKDLEKYINSRTFSRFQRFSNYIPGSEFKRILFNTNLHVKFPTQNLNIEKL